jgi:HEAT repeat protein
MTPAPHRKPFSAPRFAVRCLLALAALLASPAAGFASPDRPSDVIEALVERYRSVEGRFDDHGYETARITLEQLADLGSEEARRTLRDLAAELKHGDRRRLGIALTALVRQGGPTEIDFAIKVAESTRDDSVVDALPHYLAAARRPEGVRHLRGPVLSTATPAVKARVARALGLMGDREAVVPLLAMLREEDVRVRAEVLMAIADLGDESAFPHLVMFLKAADPRVREVTARAMGVLASPRAVPHLVAALSDPATLVAESAARSLGLLGSPGGVEPLIDRLALASKPAAPGKPAPAGEARPSDLRLADTIAKALERLTGMTLGDDADLWRAWWKENKDRPPAETSRPNAPTTISGPRYYGFGVRSSRVMFVLDVSGSMAWNERLETARKELVQVLEHLPARTRFGIVTFSEVADPWTERLVFATPENVRKAVRHVERLIAVGGTNSHDALRKAFQDEDVDTIFFLSDGSPTVGALTDPDAILAEVRELNRFRRVRVNTIALIKGDPPPRAVQGENPAAMTSLMKRLADQNDGKYVEKR